MDVTTAYDPAPALVGASNAPPDSSGQSSDLRATILTRIQERTRPAPLPKPWAFLRSTRSTRQIGCDPVDVIASLQTEFSIAQLLGARVIERSSDDKLQLSPVFGDASAGFVIRRDAARSPVDAISARGLLSSSTLDWLRFAGERADGATGHEQPVLLAFTDAEVLLFHRLSCEFTAATDLEQLSGDQARGLFAARAKRRPERRYNLTLPGWQITECIHQPAPHVLRTLESILQLKSVFNFNPAAVFDVWLPSDEEFRTICGARSFHDRDAVRSAVLRSLTNSRYTPANAWIVLNDRAEIDYGTARRKLLHSIDVSNVVPHCAEVGVALTQLRNAFSKSVLNKLLDQGTGHIDPWSRLCALVGADLADKWFGTLEEVAVARNIIDGNYPDGRGAAERLETRLRIVDRIAKLYPLGRRR